MSSSAARPPQRHSERFRMSFEIPSESADATLALLVLKGHGVRIDRVMLSVPAGQAADASNYVNFKVIKNASTLVANWSTQTGQQGTITASTPVEMVVTATAADFNAVDGDKLSLFVDTTGTITVPAGRIVVEGIEL